MLRKKGLTIAAVVLLLSITFGCGKQDEFVKDSDTEQESTVTEVSSYDTEQVTQQTPTESDTTDVATGTESEIESIGETTKPSGTETGSAGETTKPSGTETGSTGETAKPGGTTKPAGTESGSTGETAKPGGTTKPAGTETGSTGGTTKPTKPTQPEACKHTYEVSSTTAATCTRDGKKVYKCSKCSDSYEEKIAATGHDYQKKVIEPTCTSYGHTENVCSRCHDSNRDSDSWVSLLGHDYGEGEIIKAATDYAPGTKRATCKRCGVSNEVSYALPHTVDIGNGQTAVVYGYWDLEQTEEIFRQLNAYRVANGLSELARDEALDATARLRALECGYYYSHTRPTGEDCFSAYPDWRGAAENIAAGYRGATEVMEGWKNSSGHNANMLGASYNYGGVSMFVVTSGDTQGFGRYYSQNFIRK